jgi:hypothetical protein
VCSCARRLQANQSSLFCIADWIAPRSASSLKGLVKKAAAPCRRARARLIIRFGGHEDYGNPAIHFAQLGLKFETAQPWHLDIQQQTVSLRRSRIEEILGRRKDCTFIASRSKQTAQRISYGLVVINDANQRNERLPVHFVP